MDYTKLEVWIEARLLTNLSYQLTKKFPQDEIFGLTNQMRRCAVSIASNIAEGCGRSTNKETLHFLYIARGSVYELETQFYLAFDQSYINEKEINTILNQITICKKLINGFINYYKKLDNEK